jgi:two-component system, NarL family, invasion response regulator UvrY
MKVLIADDYPLIRKKLTELVRDAYPAAAVTEAGTGSEALSCLALEKFTVIFLDFRMPGLTGFETLKKAKLLAPDTPMFMISFDSQGPYAQKALESGAAGFISKEDSAEDLIKAIKTILKEEKSCTRHCEQQDI